MLKQILILCLLIGVGGCSQDTDRQVRTGTSQSQTSPAPHADSEPEHLLVFFIDPNGGPCRMQGDILSRMGEELTDRVKIRQVQTTVPEDREIFYAYGIRALPTILLADTSGREIDRLPPGVHDAGRIRDLLSRIEEN